RYGRQDILFRRSFTSLAQIAWKRAAIQTHSSTFVQMSVMRNSSVSNMGCGRISHQILARVSPLPKEPTFASVRSKLLYSAQELKLCGIPVRGSASKITLR